jgi:hypothetical protein
MKKLFLAADTDFLRKVTVRLLREEERGEFDDRLEREHERVSERVSPRKLVFIHFVRGSARRAIANPPIRQTALLHNC